MRWVIALLLILWAGNAAATEGIVYVCQNAAGLNNGTNPANAYTSIITACENAGTTDGTVIVVWGGQTELLTEDVDIGTSGDADAPIILRGDDGTHWATTSSASWPTITMQGWQFTWNYDDHWQIERMEFTDFTDRIVQAVGTDGLRFEDCTFSTANAANDYAIYAFNNNPVVFADCTFDGGANGIAFGAVNGGILRADRCTFDDWTDAIVADGGATVFLSDCIFGGTTANTDDIDIGEGARIYCAYCSFNDNTGIDNNIYGFTYSQYLDSQDRHTVFQCAPDWKLVSDYAVTNEGDYSYQASGFTANVSPANPAQLVEFGTNQDAAENDTYTLAVQRDAALAEPGTDLYLEVAYIDAGDTLAVASGSTTLTNAAQWYDISVAGVTTNRESSVLVTLIYTGNDGDGTLWFDSRLEATGETFSEHALWGVPMCRLLPPTAVGGKVIIIN